MANIRFDCPVCGQDLVVDAGEAGHTVSCPDCGKAIGIPRDRPHAAADAMLRARWTGHTRCPACGENMASGLVACTHCGWRRNVEPDHPPRTRHRTLALLRYATFSIAVVAATLYMRRRDSFRPWRFGPTAGGVVPDAPTRAQSVTPAREDVLAQRVANPSLPNPGSADNAERDPIPRMTPEAAERAVLARFPVRADLPLPVTIHLNNGTVLVAERVRDEDDRYDCRILNPARTIVTSRSIPRSDVAKIEAGARDEALWRIIRNAQLSGNSVALSYYDKVIELCFDEFLDTYPESQYGDPVRNLRAQWQAERTRIEQGYSKHEGTWYAPGERPPARLPRRTQQTLATFKRALAAGLYNRALELVEEVRIPEAFAREQADFARLVVGLLARLERKYLTAQAKLTRQRKEVEFAFRAECDAINARLFTPPRKNADVTDWDHPRIVQIRRLDFEKKKSSRLGDATRRRNAALAPIRRDEAALRASMAPIRADARRLLDACTDRGMRTTMISVAPSLLE